MRMLLFYQMTNGKFQLILRIRKRGEPCIRLPPAIQHSISEASGDSQAFRLLSSLSLTAIPARIVRPISSKRFARVNFGMNTIAPSNAPFQSLRRSIPPTMRRMTCGTCPVPFPAYRPSFPMTLSLVSPPIHPVFFVLLM